MSWLCSARPLRQATGLRHLACSRVLGQCPVELVAGGYVEFAENLAQVVTDGVPADEQPRADLGVREAVAG